LHIHRDDDTEACVQQVSDHVDAAHGIGGAAPKACAADAGVKDVSQARPAGGGGGGLVGGKRSPIVRGRIGEPTGRGKVHQHEVADGGGGRCHPLQRVSVETPATPEYSAPRAARRDLAQAPFGLSSRRTTCRCRAGDLAPSGRGPDRGAHPSGGRPHTSPRRQKKKKRTGPLSRTISRSRAERTPRADADDLRRPKQAHRSPAHAAGERERKPTPRPSAPRHRAAPRPAPCGRSRAISDLIHQRHQSPLRLPGPATACNTSPRTP